MGCPQVSDNDYRRLQGYILQTNDIVFSRVGSIDINALITESQKNWLFSGRVLRVRLLHNINSGQTFFRTLDSAITLHQRKWHIWNKPV
jgi:hypothetical protein